MKLMHNTQHCPHSPFNIYTNALVSLKKLSCELSDGGQNGWEVWEKAHRILNIDKIDILSRNNTSDISNIDPVNFIVEKNIKEKASNSEVKVCRTEGRITGFI